MVAELIAGLVSVLLVRVTVLVGVTVMSLISAIEPATVLTFSDKADSTPFPKPPMFVNGTSLIIDENVSVSIFKSQVPSLVVALVTALVATTI